MIRFLTHSSARSPFQIPYFNMIPNSSQISKVTILRLASDRQSLDFYRLIKHSILAILHILVWTLGFLGIMHLRFHSTLEKLKCT